MCKNRDSETEMNEGNLPTINVNEDKNEKGKEINEVIDSEYINLNQERSYKIFEFFNDLRQNPKNYIEESKNYNLDDIITLADNNKLNLNIRMLIQNPFYNLILESCVQKNNIKEEILSDLESNSQFDNYQKILYIIKSDNDNPNDFVWLLLQENKDNALEEILYKNFDFFVVSSNSILGEIYVYFLFLKKI